MCFKESSFIKNVKHYYHYVKGKCGVDIRYWGKDLKENDIPINSLRAGEYVINYYLEKHNGDKVKALSDYKGIITQKHLVKQVLDLENRLLNIGWELVNE